MHVQPLLTYPKLLDTILNKIKREDTPKIRCELIRLLGIMGALDPYRHKMLQLTMLEDDNEKKTAGRAEEIMKGVSLSSDDYYPAVALSTLIKFLRNPYGSLATVRLLLNTPLPCYVHFVSHCPLCSSNPWLSNLS
jgi:FKBP12-rapamycin complex-associated protein